MQTMARITIDLFRKALCLIKLAIFASEWNFERGLIVALLIVLTACNLEPPYQRPCMQIPCTWRIESDQASTTANVRWWEALGDLALNELIFIALNNNKDLMVAVSRVCEFVERYQVVRSQMFPQIAFGAEALKERIPSSESPTGEARITPFYLWEFTASYELDFWGQIQSQVHAAWAEALASVQNRRTVILSLVSSVAAAYVQLRELDRELEIAFATLEERREYLRLAILRFEGGLTSEIEVTQAAATFEQVLADVTVLEALIPQQENLLSLLIGLPPGPILRGKNIDELTLPCFIPTGLPSELLERRPDILAAELHLVAANAEIGAARAAFFPQISLTGVYGGESFQLKNLFSPSSRFWQIGANLLQPIFTGGKLIGELNIAKAEKCEALYAYEQTVLVALKEVNDALIAYRQTKELVKAQEGNVSANKEYLRLSWLRYYNGQTDYLTVLDAETRLFVAQISLTQAQGDLFFAYIDIFKALGGGWVIDADCYLRNQ
jgi:multidrug efflux system outer membrane protein